jgi:hypothetical protein
LRALRLRPRLDITFSFVPVGTLPVGRT